MCETVLITMGDSLQSRPSRDQVKQVYYCPKSISLGLSSAMSNACFPALTAVDVVKL
ncbi:hypothetical protein [Oceanobacillus senegalensis]|uniref:hypothetical protein n=1 Tax=Oceanobacillus senegalensis TaxID=1936063 RepID=UPI001C4E8B0D|nr:hypothetical protein [Oceanobacillus senegalensis]